MRLEPGRAIDCSFQRLQFTSDMVPSEVLGAAIYNAHTETVEFKQGPIFTHFLLADEINRTTPKTQSALLEAMNENQITVEGRTLPLPESQLDQFLMRLRIGYPDASSEREILRRRETDNSGAGGARGRESALFCRRRERLLGGDGLVLTDNTKDAL
jgi:MoxR-like ATPase